MRAIILAAGEGKRLRPLTSDRPKCLVNYRGKAIIDYQLENFCACGIEDIVIVKGYKADEFHRSGARFIVNHDYASTNMVYTLFCAREYFDDDIIISYGDIVYEPSILDALIQNTHDLDVAVSTNWRELWEKRMVNPLDDAETMKINDLGFITELGKKPKNYDEIQGQFMGLIKINRASLSKAESFYASLNRNVQYEGRDFNNMYMTTFLQILIDNGFPAKAVRVTGQWLEVDSISDLNIARNV